ncbi:MAG: aminotransferase class I/II-fold pyridoxal phosphate-dependent enzyme [Clostridia bacterium]|nr:aminotransferase class I/II-fold pyridoxal phosphate-dependent enzyme [Oscillospiraceae bacterium]MBO4932622.1 aminotransferase class I/II-fold pyridoxal phosphate-dependent enzyme [Clostridia bacterium]
MDYSKILSPTVQEIKPSGIRKFFDLLENMQGVVALTVGQPDFITPWHIRVAAIESLENGKTYYTSNSGTLELRQEISAYMNRRYQLTYDPKHEVIVTVGGSEAIDIAMRAVIAPGDEVIIPQPAFVCYGPICELAGGKPVYINTKEENKFKLTADELKSVITPKTKMLVLPYPNNPTGAIMTREDLEEIAEVLRGTDIMILSDEIYCELTYGRDHVSIASLDGMRERTIIASGFSKTYAMTGWRLGYTLAPAEITTQMLKIHQYAIMCAPTTSQYAAVEAMRNGDADVEMMRKEYNRRRRYIVGGLRSLGIDCFDPEGAFYVYPNISKFGLSSEEFCERLLQEEKAAIVPGTAFGDCGEGFARISYAYSVEHIAKALDRIERFVKKL